MAIADAKTRKLFTEFSDQDVGSDKTFSDFQHNLALEYCWVSYSSSGAVGNRLLTLEVLDKTGLPLIRIHSRANQQPNEVVSYTIYPGGGKLAAGSIPQGFDDVIEMALPSDFIIEKTQTLRIYDINQRDTGGDVNLVSGQFSVLRS